MKMKDDKTTIPSKHRDYYPPTPAGFLEEIPELIMARIDRYEVERKGVDAASTATVRRISLFEKIKPTFYLAATFLLLVGLFSVVRLTYSGVQPPPAQHSTYISNSYQYTEASSEDADYMTFVESQYIDMMMESALMSGSWGAATEVNYTP